MANRGNKPLKKKETVINSTTLHCLCCGEEIDTDKLYSSDSDIYGAIGKIPYCVDCLEKIYQFYVEKYRGLEYKNPSRKAVERICMALDIYYSDNIYDAAMKEFETKTTDVTLISLYIRQSKLYQYRKRNYDTTIQEKLVKSNSEDKSLSLSNSKDSKDAEVIEKATKLFGSGFSDDDYIYLYEQYSDWTTRHECETKSQEEVFKRICFKQLEILKATRRGEDTKDLDATFQKWLDTAKLQPKQNKGETVSEAQTFGTLIDKWENTRPIPEIDEDLRDVDKIGLYLDTFFRGHLAKMMGLKNGLSHLYDEYMKKYTVEKPEYDDDESGEALFDAIFGSAMDDE